MTNADKIRAMSDEELADIFLRADFCKCCEHEKDGVCNYIFWATGKHGQKREGSGDKNGS